ncbi:conserved hypothetical protein [Leishmania major strain Friedlin]|uniref:Uncharacterized protein n=1 Tax=Leishmania major TaxID=5664 RepID=Q4QHV1_LEIMA|nr:conserved hypothetical protein [Leishmania major strain Friedlin]CAG9569688.1 hypothetical_protein_-__conserved [Leishmania major strain Friedlin]CAJ02680.1 conserved hypothetical protein [Leishmania major strain Friedlin]|eukprot:XP_001681247.1 conserved hypothetical protein [Leishmania major strain Friedlin]
MDASSTLPSASVAASSLVSSPFVPCIEDSAHTRRVGRHPVLFQRTLDAVSYRYLTASSRLARTVASSSSDKNVGSVALQATATANAAHAAYVTTLTENYQQLWQQRGLVPKAARREWFETVVVHLKALNALGATLAWLTDAPATVASAALSDHDDGDRKQQKSRKLAHDPLPLWCLWQDAQRHLHHMSLRLRPRPPAAGVAYGTREAMRMSDLARMDSAAFAWRVRQWCCVAALFRRPGGADTGAASSLVGVAEAVHPGMLADVVCRVGPGGSSSMSAASPFPDSFSAEEPEVARMLRLCLGPTSETAAENCLARQYVAGALVYRMLLEVTLGRLRALPRCIFTWRLLRDVVRDHLVTSAAGFHDTGNEQMAVLLEMAAYVEVVVIPYLQHRDCHLASLRHTAAQVHAQFTRLASAKLEQLRAAVARAGAGDGDEMRTVAESEAGTPDAVVDDVNAATAPAAEANAEVNKEEQGRLPEAQRHRMTASMEPLLRRACAGGAPAFAETIALPLPTSHTASESAVQGAKDVIASIILGNTVTSDRAKRDEAGGGHQGDVPPAPSGSWEDALLSMRHDFHGKRVDDSVLHSSAARISQLRFFLYHYFTQSPTLAFDRVSDTAAAPAHADAGKEGEAY